MPAELDDANNRLNAGVLLLNFRIYYRMGHARMSLAVSIRDILGPVAWNDQRKQQEEDEDSTSWPQNELRSRHRIDRRH